MYWVFEVDVRDAVTSDHTSLMMMMMIILMLDESTREGQQPRETRWFFLMQDRGSTRHTLTAGEKLSGTTGTDSSTTNKSVPVPAELDCRVQIQ